MYLASWDLRLQKYIHVCAMKMMKILDKFIFTTHDVSVFFGIAGKFKDIELKFCIFS